MKGNLPDYSERNVLHLIDLVYEAAVHPPAWTKFLEAFAETTRAGTTSLLWYDFKSLQGSVSFSVRSDPAHIREYEKHYGGLDIWASGWRNAGTSGMIALGEEFCSEKEMKETEFYNDFMRRFDAYHALGGCILREDGSMGAISALRPKRAGRFELETRLLRVLMPHLQRALKIHQRLSKLENGLATISDAFDELPLGILVVNRLGKVLLANRMARETVQRSDGLRISGGLIAAARAAETSDLREMIYEAATSTSRVATRSRSAMSISRPSLQRSYAVMIVPNSQRTIELGTSHGEAILFCTDPERELETDHHLIARLLDLTRTEAKLAALLFKGIRLEDASERLSITRQTARTHLKRIFNKTSTHRQSELIKLMFTTIPRIRLR